MRWARPEACPGLAGRLPHSRRSRDGGEFHVVRFRDPGVLLEAGVFVADSRSGSGSRGFRGGPGRSGRSARSPRTCCRLRSLRGCCGSVGFRRPEPGAPVRRVRPAALRRSARCRRGATRGGADQKPRWRAAAAAGLATTRPAGAPEAAGAGTHLAARARAVDESLPAGNCWPGGWLHERREAATSPAANRPGRLVRPS